MMPESEQCVDGPVGQRAERTRFRQDVGRCLDEGGHEGPGDRGGNGVQGDSTYGASPAREESQDSDDAAEDHDR